MSHRRQSTSSSRCPGQFQALRLGLQDSDHSCGSQTTPQNLWSQIPGAHHQHETKKPQGEDTQISLQMILIPGGKNRASDTIQTHHTLTICHCLMTFRESKTFLPTHHSGSPTSSLQASTLKISNYLTAWKRPQKLGHLITPICQLGTSMHSHYQW